MNSLPAYSSSSSSSKRFIIIILLVMYSLIYFWMSIRPVDPKLGPLEISNSNNSNHPVRRRREIDDQISRGESPDDNSQKSPSRKLRDAPSVSSSSPKRQHQQQLPKRQQQLPPLSQGGKLAKYIEKYLMSSEALRNPSSVKKIFNWKAVSCNHASWLESSVLMNKRYKTGGFLEEYDELNKMVRKTDKDGNPVDPAEHDFYPYVSPPPRKVCVFAGRGIWQTPFEPTMVDDVAKTPVSIDALLDRVDIASADYNVDKTAAEPNPERKIRREPGPVHPPVLNSKGINTDAVAPADPGQEMFEKLFAKIGGAVFRGGIPVQQAQMMVLLGLSRMPKVPMKVRVCKRGDRSAWCDYAHRPVAQNPPPNSSEDYVEEKTQQIVRLNFRGNSYGRAFTSAFAAIFRGRERYFDRGVHTFVRYLVTNYGDYYYFSPRFFNGDIAYAPFVRVERPDEVVFFEVCFEFSNGHVTAVTDTLETPRSTLFNIFEPSFKLDPILRSGGEFSGILMRPFRFYFYRERALTCPCDERHRVHAQWMITKHLDCGVFRRKDPNSTSATAPPCFAGMIQAPPRQRIECAPNHDAQLKLTMLQLEKFQSTLPTPASALQDDDTPNWIKNDFNERNSPLPRKQFATRSGTTSRNGSNELVPAASSSSSSSSSSYSPSLSDAPRFLPRQRKFLWIPQPRGLELESFSNSDNHWHTQMIVGGHYPEPAEWIRGGEDIPPYDGVAKPDKEIIWNKVEIEKRKYLATGISPDPKRLNVTKPNFNLTTELYALVRSNYRALHLTGDRYSRKLLFKYFFSAFLNFEGEH